MPPSQINQILVNLIGTARLVLALLFVLALLVFVWGMVKFIFAASNPEQLKKARGILWWGVIGMFVLASVFGIVVAIQVYFGVAGDVPVPIPQFGPIPAGSGIGGSGSGIGIGGSGSGAGACVGPSHPCFHDPDPFTCSGGLPLCPGSF